MLDSGKFRFENSFKEDKVGKKSYFDRSGWFGGIECHLLQFGLQIFFGVHNHFRSVDRHTQGVDQFLLVLGRVGREAHQLVPWNDQVPARVPGHLRKLFCQLLERRP